MIRRNCFVITLGMVLLVASLPALGQQKEQIEQVLQQIEYEVDKYNFVARPGDVDEEYKYVVNFETVIELTPLNRKVNYTEAIYQKYAELVDATPREYLPEEEIRNYLKTQKKPAFTIRVATTYASKAGVQRQDHEVKLYAISEQKAKELVQGFITVCVVGGSMTKRKYLEDSIPEQEEKKKELNLQVEKLEKEIPEIEVEMKNYSLVPDTAKASLENKRWLNEVDLVGVKARMEVAQEMIKKYPPGRMPVELDNIRITAQIELASLLAQQKKINEILESAKNHVKLMMKSIAQREKLNESHRAIRNCDVKIRNSQEQIEDLSSQTFKVSNNRVTILPLNERGK